MATQLRISGLACGLLALAALLAAGARADWVTTAQCRARGVKERVRLYPTDSNATELWMNGCGITKMNSYIFSGLPNLNGVYLNNNSIENINLAAFHTVPPLTKLRLFSNKLRHLPVFDERLCANLTMLRLNNNKLTVVDNADTFSACAKLRDLQLNNNDIEHLHPNLFSALTELVFLLLNDNKIRFIPDEMFTNNPKLDWLYLQNNLITHLPPDFASGLQRAGTRLRHFSFHGNPWHCACLLELWADVKRAGVIYYKVVDVNNWSGPYYDGSRPECNFIGMYIGTPSGLLQLAPRATFGGAS